VAISMLILVYRATHPRGVVLGQLPGTEAYRDIRQRPEAVTFPGLLIWRVGGALFFASVGHFVEELQAALSRSQPPVNHVILDADTVIIIDSTAGDELLRLIEELRSRGITLAFARVRDQVRDFMRRAGIEAAVGSANFYDRVTDGLHTWQRASGISPIVPAIMALAGVATE
jgi:MFS superfamily sulfate permease-like transporter